MIIVEMLCSRYSSTFDKEATKSLENVVPESKKRKPPIIGPKFSFTKSYIHFINNSSTTNYVNKDGRGKAYVPYAKPPVHKWVQSTHNNVKYENNNVVKDNTSNVVTKNVTTDVGNPYESKKVCISQQLKRQKSYDAHSMEKVSKIQKGHRCKS